MASGHHGARGGSLVTRLFSESSGNGGDDLMQGNCSDLVLATLNCIAFHIVANLTNPLVMGWFCTAVLF